jgi:predicted enzyme related to lactoylglutathione lyase
MRNWRGLWFVCALAASGAVHAQSPIWPPVGEPTTAPRVTGRWLWADLVTADAARSRDFYAALFGWQIRGAEGAGQPSHLTITANGRMIGGIVQAANATSGARWIELVDGDPKALAERAVQHGGKVVVAPRTLPGRGDFMVLADPAGAHFAVVLPSAVIRRITSAAATNGSGASCGRLTLRRRQRSIGTCSATRSPPRRVRPAHRPTHTY